MGQGHIDIAMTGGLHRSAHSKIEVIHQRLFKPRHGATGAAIHSLIGFHLFFSLSVYRCRLMNPDVATLGENAHLP
jgi:hypothetical protein